MIHNSGLNNKINHIHERALRIVHNDYDSSFEDLLNKDKSITYHQRNLQQLAINIFLKKIGTAPKNMNDIITFIEKNTLNLRSGMHLTTLNVHSAKYGTESTGNLGTKSLTFVPVYIKHLNALSAFKNHIRK